MNGDRVSMRENLSLLVLPELRAAFRSLSLNSCLINESKVSFPTAHAAVVKDIQPIWLILPVVICLFQRLSHANVRVFVS